LLDERHLLRYYGKRRRDFNRRIGRPAAESIVSAVLAVILLVIIILRRKAKRKDSDDGE
jgi:hypothetical protein